MAWVATTSFETTDGSTSPVDGNTVTSTGDGTGWSATWTHNATYPNYFKYDNGASSIPDGSWVTIMDTSGGNYEPYIRRTLTTNATSGRVAFYYRTDKDSRDHNIVYLRDGTNRKVTITMPQVTINTGRHLADAALTTIASNVFQETTWYKVDLDFDCTTDTFDVYVNDVKKNGSALAFENVGTEVTLIGFENAAASGFDATAGNIFYIDYIHPYSSAGGATTIYPQNLPFMGVG